MFVAACTQILDAGLHRDGVVAMSAALDARDAQGKSWGTITAIFDFGAGDILELTERGKRSQLIPFNETSVLEIDFEGGSILIDPVAAGLINPDGDDDDQDADGKPGKGKG